MSTATLPAAISHALAPRSQWTPAARKLRDTYAITPGAPFLRQEFGLWMCIDAWKEAGLPDRPHAEMFDWDDNPRSQLGQLGWCEAAFCPKFEEKVLEERGDHELAQDHAGRKVLFFKGRRTGFMPEYLDHPVKDLETWERDVKWRLDPKAPGRFDGLAGRMATAQTDAERGHMVVQGLIGGYMYLRSLMGPEALLYMSHDQPELIHDCMRTWFNLADAVVSEHQKHITIDEIFFAEDICYNKGSLISPKMMRTFLFPYYQQLLTNLRRRQLDPQRHLYIQVDTDGLAVPVIEVYRELGMEVMSPFEVASGCDVVEIGKRYPWLVMTGGIDKRVLAEGPAAIDRHLERILPAMRARGGYIPTIDHGVPPETPWRNYLHYRKRCVEMGG